MAEQDTATTPDQSGTDPTKTDGQTPPAEPKQQNDDSNNKNVFDTSKLSDDDFNNIFNDDRLYKHPRFKSLSERAKEAEKLKTEQEKAEKKALKEQNKFKELYEKTEAEKLDLQNKVKESAIRSSLQTAAVELGVVDVDAAYQLADKSGLDVGDDGTVTGAKEVIQALIESKPYLAGKNTPQTIGSGSNPNPDQTEAGTKRYKLSQIQDHTFFKENEKDIIDAFAKGLVEDDINNV